MSNTHVNPSLFKAIDGSLSLLYLGFQFPQRSTKGGLIHRWPARPFAVLVVFGDEPLHRNERARHVNGEPVQPHRQRIGDRAQLFPRPPHALGFRETAGANAMVSRNRTIQNASEFVGRRKLSVEGFSRHVTRFVRLELLLKGDNMPAPEEALAAVAASRHVVRREDQP